MTPEERDRELDAIRDQHVLALRMNLTARRMFGRRGHADLARKCIRRIRALDAVRTEAESGAGKERARIALYLHRLGDYGMHDLAEQIMRGEHEP
jgi:hypothetical protein